MNLLGQARQAASGRKSLGVGFCQSWREDRILPTIAAGIVAIAGSEPLVLCYQWLRLSSNQATYIVIRRRQSRRRRSEPTNREFLA
jgi:hypothetical protein